MIAASATVDVFRGLNLFLSAILGGGMALELLIVVPAVAGLAQRPIVDVHRRVADRSLRFVLATGVPSAAAAIVVLALKHDFGDAATILRLIGVVVLLCGAAATITLYLPVFQKTKGLPSDALPELYEDVLPRWSRAQLVRTIFYVGSLACFVAADVLF
jgi:uncharacterized membrane protein